MKKIVNLELEQQKNKTKNQINANLEYVKQLDNINEDLKDREKNIVISDDLETFRKIFKITADMTTEDSNIFKVIYAGSELSAEKKDEAIHTSLRFHSKKRKEIIKLATGETNLTTEQEVALCGAIFRIAVAVPALLELDGRGISK